MKPVNRAFNIAVRHMAAQLFPTGFDVKADAPSSIIELCKSFESGRLTVWNGASDNTIFACPETNYCFRAWHDHCHVRPNLRMRDIYNESPICVWNPKISYPFTRVGESLAMRGQIADVYKLYGNGLSARTFSALIEAEIIGQFDYAANHGGAFPVYQADFARAYLANPESAVRADFGISIEV